MKKVISHGTAIVRGYADGKVYQYHNASVIPQSVLSVDEEILLLKEGIKKTFNVTSEITSILNDQNIVDQFLLLITNYELSAAQSVNQILTSFYQTLSKTDDIDKKRRADDFKALNQKLLANILDFKSTDLSLVTESVVIVAKQLDVIDLSKANPKFIKGIICEYGSATSHTAILAGNWRVPFVIGISDVFNKFFDGDSVYINGEDGTVYSNPSKESIIKWSFQRHEYDAKILNNQKYCNVKTLTKDNKRMLLKANIDRPNGIEDAEINGYEGVGLFRSEFLYINNNDWPSEKQQYDVYSEALKLARPKSVVIRTLDIGGDKNLKYYTFDKEMNPFLGNRAIR